jgi:pimeloyl-ACP methyl ester carboxylesterase
MAVVFVNIALDGKSQRLEYELINPEMADRLLLIFLHEGLGSLTLWRDFPKQLCDSGRFRGLVYSRAGYGKSMEAPPSEHYDINYMHREASEILPVLLTELGLEGERPALFGHSDGASIALIFASLFPERASGVIALAPHIFVEDIAIRGIEKTGEIYHSSDMKSRLGRYHHNPDMVFRRWHDIWLSPEFRAWNIEKLLPAIRCPILAIQGYDDEYASMAQIDGLKKLLPQSEILMLPDCRHSPHKDQPQLVMETAVNFIAKAVG